MSAPLVVNTADGACWTRRAVTEGGVALYALADVCSCPEFVMVTFEELAARGIVGSAFVVPAPVGPEPEAPSPERLRLAWESAKRDRRELRHGLEFAESSRQRWRTAAIEAEAERDALRARVASLEAERHSTNESLSEAAEQLRRDRDRIAELEALAGAASEYRLDEPGYGLLIRPAPRGSSAAGWAVFESRRLPHGRRAWTSAGWAYDPSHEELFCWPSAEVAVTEARRVMPGAVVRAEGDVAPQVERLRTLLAGQREQRAAEGCPRNVIDGNAGGHFFKKGALTGSPVACIYCGTRKSETGDAS
jgi:hypothetical protein